MQVRELVKLSIKSLWSRRTATFLSILSISLGVLLFLSIERIRIGARNSFSQTISQTDLIVGARSGSINLLLYSVFHIGNATNNISMQSFDHFQSLSSVSWVIPISLGDSHRGYRVVATDRRFFDHYKFGKSRPLDLATGKWFDAIDQVVIGSEVAGALEYSVGSSLVLAHGISDQALYEHTDSPFHVSGVLSRTNTPVDRSIFISLEAMEAIHKGWQNGVPGESASHFKNLALSDLKPRQITAFLVGMKERIDLLRLQREVNEYDEEPLLAIIPGLSLSELWQGLGYVETVMQAIASVVVLVSLIGLIISIFSTLNERRREFAVLRAVGISAFSILILFLIETLTVTAIGLILGVAAVYASLWVFMPIIETNLGVLVSFSGPSVGEFEFLGFFVCAALVLGTFLGFLASRKSLEDGLQIRI